MPRTHLDAVFAADRALRDAESALLESPGKALRDVLAAAVEEAKTMDDREEGDMRLERLADLCAQVPGPEMVDALIQILDENEPRVRVAAGEALLDVAYDYYAEVARAIERVLDVGADGPAMTELPFLLAEVGEPSARALLEQFMKHEQAKVVAAGIEASVLLMDPDILPALQTLVGDAREVTVEDYEDETTATVGQLATEAIEEIGAAFGDDA